MICPTLPCPQAACKAPAEAEDNPLDGLTLAPPRGQEDMPSNLGAQQQQQQQHQECKQTSAAGEELQGKAAPPLGEGQGAGSSGRDGGEAAQQNPCGGPAPAGPGPRQGGGVAAAGPRPRADGAPAKNGGSDSGVCGAACKRACGAVCKHVCGAACKRACGAVCELAAAFVPRGSCMNVAWLEQAGPSVLWLYVWGACQGRAC